MSQKERGWPTAITTTICPMNECSWITLGGLLLTHSVPALSQYCYAWLVILRDVRSRNSVGVHGSAQVYLVCYTNRSWMVSLLYFYKHLLQQVIIGILPMFPAFVIPYYH
ncbi:hypothetical protein K0M31_017320 [Melipona bicolor]|uniref:Uncharacterized protein n=1 Tax=Melipona bicolor TaxID=60889 RepID=A0AA40G4L3_9HYME|nr:hypothetical protein K0M31_017320 [Melipona bicolor]